MQRHFKDSDELCEYVRSKHEHVTLSFSCGKDSIGAWLKLREFWDKDKITPVFFYQVPDLQFIEKSIRYYEDFFDTKIYRMPNVGFYRQVRNFVYQPPINCKYIDAMQIPNIKIEHLEDMLNEDLGIQNNAVGVGLKASDNYTRGFNLRKNGTYNPSNRKFYPIYDWNKERLENELLKVDVCLPIDYQIWGNTFDGLQFKYILGVKQNFPEDYERLKRFFPMLDLELFRHKKRLEELYAKI